MFAETNPLMVHPSHIHRGNSIEQIREDAQDCHVCNAKTIIELFDAVLAMLDEQHQEIKGLQAWVRAQG